MTQPEYLQVWLEGFLVGRETFFEESIRSKEMLALDIIEKKLHESKLDNCLKIMDKKL